MNCHLLDLQIEMFGLGVGLANLGCCVSCHGASFGLTFVLIGNLLTSSKSMGWEHCSGLSWVLLCEISLGEGRWGPTGVDLKIRRRSSSDLPEDFAVSKAVLIVSICLSIKPFDLG